MSISSACAWRCCAAPPIPRIAAPRRSSRSPCRATTPCATGRWHHPEEKLAGAHRLRRARRVGRFHPNAGLAGIGAGGGRLYRRRSADPGPLVRPFPARLRAPRMDLERLPPARAARARLRFPAGLAAGTTRRSSATRSSSGRGPASCPPAWRRRSAPRSWPRSPIRRAGSSACHRDVGRLEQVRARLAIIRGAVDPEYRRGHIGLVAATSHARDLLERWSAEHPEERLAGVGAFIESKELAERARRGQWADPPRPDRLHPRRPPDPRLLVPGFPAGPQLGGAARPAVRIRARRRSGSGCRAS